MTEKEFTDELAKATNAIPTKAKVIIGVLGIALILGIAGYFLTKNDQKAIVVSPQVFADTKVLADTLDINVVNASALQDFYNATIAGTVAPLATYTVSAPTIAQAAKTVATQINKKDTSIPAAALEVTDRTVVVPNVAQQKVDVYKVNLYKNWEIGIGAGVHNSDAYVAVSAQRNYSKDHAIEAEVHVKPTGAITGGEVKYKVMTDKLFGIF